MKGYSIFENRLEKYYRNSLFYETCIKVNHHLKLLYTFKALLFVPNALQLFQFQLEIVIDALKQGILYVQTRWCNK